MSTRDDLARLLWQAEKDAQPHSHAYADTTYDDEPYEYRRITEAQADAVLSEWLPTLADDEALVDAVTRIICYPALEPSMYLEFTREHLQALATTLSPTSPAPVRSPQSSPASDGPGETVPGAGEHDGHPGAPSPASGGPSSGGAA